MWTAYISFAVPV